MRTCFTAWPRLRPSTVIAVCRSANDDALVRRRVERGDELSLVAEAGRGLLDGHALGQHAAEARELLRVRDSFIDSAFGGATVRRGVVVVVVVPVPVVEPLVVVDAVIVAPLPLPLPCP